jgi:hypothetical protein
MSVREKKPSICLRPQKQKSSGYFLPISKPTLTLKAIGKKFAIRPWHGNLSFPLPILKQQRMILVGFLTALWGLIMCWFFSASRPPTPVLDTRKSLRDTLIDSLPISVPIQTLLGSCGMRCLRAKAAHLTRYNKKRTLPARSSPSYEEYEDSSALSDQRRKV